MFIRLAVDTVEISYSISPQATKSPKNLLHWQMMPKGSPSKSSLFALQQPVKPITIRKGTRVVGADVTPRCINFSRKCSCHESGLTQILAMRKHNPSYFSRRHLSRIVRSIWCNDCWGVWRPRRCSLHSSEHQYNYHTQLSIPQRRPAIIFVILYRNQLQSHSKYLPSYPSRIYIYCSRLRNFSDRLCQKH